MRVFEADLHVHTALSPCAEAEMTPPAIVRQALRCGLDMIAVCDHNAADHTAAVAEAAGAALAVVAGMEITTAEEVHVIGLFPSPAFAAAAAAEVQQTLPEVTEQSITRFGAQLVFDAAGRIVGRVSHLLAAASSLDLAEAASLVRRHGGLVVAAHVDRPSFSVFAQLGVFPTEVGFDAVEVSAANAAPPWADRIRALPLPKLRSSDAHFLAQLGAARTRLRLQAPSFAELSLALAGRDGREVL